MALTTLHRFSGVNGRPSGVSPSALTAALKAERHPELLFVSVFDGDI